MKHMKRIVPIIVLIALLFSLPMVANATPKVKTYKASRVTAKQIVTEMRKVVPAGKTYKMKESDLTTGDINSYKSKYSFYDKKFKKVYCTVEVFKNRDDAVRRAGYMDCLNMFYATFGQKEDVPLWAMQYKNVVLRVGTKMPYKKAEKYYKALKKIVR